MTDLELEVRLATLRCAGFLLAEILTHPEGAKQLTNALESGDEEVNRG